MAIGLKDIREFFGYPTLGAFSADWKALSQHEREQIKGGIEDGTFDYAV